MTAQRRWFLSLAIYGMFFLFCEKDLTGPVSNKTNDTPTPGDLNLLTSKTVGPEGSVIQTDSLTITIPANAIQEETQISIFQSAETTPLDQFKNSTLYQIDGLPAEFNLIEIRLAHHGAVNGDTLVAIGEKAFAKSPGDSAYSFIAQNAKVDSGSLVFTLGAAGSLKKNNHQYNKTVNSAIRFTALSGYSTLPSSDNHFIINYPNEMAPQAAQLGQFFEAAYDSFQTMGFSFSGRTSPVKVMVADLAHPGEYAYLMPRTPTDASIRANINRGRFTISTSIMNDAEKLATTAGHEFMHLIQNMYEFSDPYVMPEQMWLSEALAVWVEEKFSTESNFISPQLAGNEIRFLLGWQHAAAVHGYGMSTLIKQIADTYGDAAIVKIIENIRDGNLPFSPVDPVDAVLSVIPIPVEPFWHYTLSDYILGDLYDGTVSQNLLSESANYAYSFTIDGPDDTLTTMLCGFNDLSGALIKINLNYTDIDSAASLHLAVDDSINCGLVVCAFKNGAINKLAESAPGNDGTIDINNLTQLTQAGQDLILLVSNSRHQPPYDGTNDVLLTLKIETPSESFPDDSSPVLNISNALSMGYWKYLAAYQTPEGQDETLFTYKLNDPGATATASIFKPDSGWIYTQPINGVTSINFTGTHLATVAPDICPGTTDSILIRVENESGADTAFAILNVGEFFDGVTVIDSSANWSENFVFPTWFCEDNSLMGPFSGSNLRSSVNRQNYICGGWAHLAHTSIVNFNLDFDCLLTGNATCNYTILATHNQPAEEEWNVQFTFNSTFVPGITTFDGSEYFLFIGVPDVATTIQQREVWTFSDKADSVWTNSTTTKGGMLLGLQGKINY